MRNLRFDSSRARHIYRYYIVELDGKALVVGLDSRIELEFKFIVEIGDDFGIAYGWKLGRTTWRVPACLEEHRPKGRGPKALLL